MQRLTLIAGFAALGCLGFVAAPAFAQSPPLATHAGAPATIPPGPTDNGPPPAHQKKLSAKPHKASARPAGRTSVAPAGTTPAQ